MPVFLDKFLSEKEWGLWQGYSTQHWLLNLLKNVSFNEDFS